MAAHELLLIDAFADGPFTGNPAAVVLLDAPADAAWMQAVAAELKQSETAFCWPHQAERAPGEGPGPEWKLRWFTPRCEVELCGHATLATAHALWSTGRLDRDEAAVFRTRAGLLQAWRVGEEIELDLPATPDEPVTLTQELAMAFRLPPRYLGRYRDSYVIELESESAVRSVTPDPALLLEAGGHGYTVTARASADKPYDFVLRYFAPAVGVPEDPVTGAAFACLGPYWSLRLGRPDLVGRQVSARGGTVRVHSSEARVRLGGRARTVVQGALLG
ncbi:PhzF family phenazine biosynthesis protein [Myxococcota bacterium]|nr:PhzF family phenazine biosynthesis protein [Myxococcota bacterium]